MQRILAGTDGSVSAQVAVRWAVELAAETDVPLLIAHAWRPSFAEMPPETSDRLRSEAGRRLEDEWCVPAREAGIGYEPLVLDGDPRPALLAAAETRDADLLVVGARGAAKHPHAPHLGSVTHHLVHHTERPLAAIPASARSVDLTRLVVGVDGSEGSARAVDWCADVAPTLHATVLAVYGERLLAEWVPRDDPSSWYQRALDDCDKWTAPLRDADVPTRALVVDHEPVTALTNTAIHERAGMIVVGTHGRGGFTGLRLGSTALEVLHDSGCPVVLVP